MKLDNAATRRADYWFRRHSDAIAVDSDEVPVMTVTPDEYTELRALGKPWHTLSDGREAWAGVVVQVSDAEGADGG